MPDFRINAETEKMLLNIVVFIFQMNKSGKEYMYYQCLSILCACKYCQQCMLRSTALPTALCRSSIVICSCGFFVAPNMVTLWYTELLYILHVWVVLNVT